MVCIFIYKGGEYMANNEISLTAELDSKQALKALEGILDGIKDIAKIAKQQMEIQLDISQSIKDLKTVNNALQDVKENADIPINIDTSSTKGFAGTLSSMFSGIGSTITSFLNPLNLIPNLFSGISSAAGLLSSAFSGLISVMSTIGSLVSSAIMLPFQAVSAVFNTITGVISSVVGGFTELVFFVGNLGQAFDTLIRFAQPVINFFTGIYDSLSNAVNVTADFEKQISNVASVTGASAEEMKQLSDAALNVGAVTSLSASQAAEALYALGSAGLSTQDAIAALEGTAKLSEATQSNLASSTELVVSAITQYGMTASDAVKISNVFAAGVAGSQLNMERLGASMKYVGPVAKTFGLSIEGTVGVLGALSKAGIMGEMAGTALRSALTDLLNPTGRAKETLTALGISTEEMNKKITTASSSGLNPFVAALELLQAKGMTSNQVLALFGDTGGPAMSALLSQGINKIKEMETTVTGTNATFDMAKVQLDNYAGAAMQLSGSIETVQILIGGVFQKSLTLVTNTLIEVVNGFTNFLQTTGLVTSATQALTGITQIFITSLNMLSPITNIIIRSFTALGTILATIISSVTNYIATNESFKSSFSGISSVITMLSTVLLELISNITGLSPNVLTLGANLETLKTTVAAYINQLLSSVSAQNAFKIILDSILSVIKTVSVALSTITVAVLQFINSFQFQNLKTGEGILNAIALATQNLAKYINESITSITLWAAEFIKSGDAFNTLKTILSTSISIIQGVVNALLLIPAAASKILPMINELAKGLSTAFLLLTQGDIKGSIEQVFNTITTSITNFIGALAGNKEKLTTTFKQIFDGISTGFVDINNNIIKPGIESFKLALQNGLLQSIAEIAAKISESIKQIGTAISTGLSSVFKGVKSIGELLKESLGAGNDTTSQIFSPVVEAIKQGIEIIKVTINEGVPALKSLVIPLILDFIAAIKESINFLPVSEELKKGLLQIATILEQGISTEKFTAMFKKLKEPIITVIKELAAEIKNVISVEIKNAVTGGFDIALSGIIIGIGIWAASLSTTISTAVTGAIGWFSTTGIAVFVKSIGTWLAGTAIALPALIVGFSVVIGQYLIQSGLEWAGYFTTALLTAGLAITAGIAAWPALALAAIAGVGLAIYNYLIGNSLIDDIPMWFGEVFQATVDYFGTVGEILAAPFMAIWDFIAESTTAITESITTLTNSIVETIVSIFTSGTQLIADTFNSIWTFMTETITTVTGYATEIANGIINTINDLITTGKDTIINTFNNIWETIKGMVQTVIDIGTSIGEGLMNAINGAIEMGKSAIETTINGIVSIAQTAYDNVMSIVNSAKAIASAPIEVVANVASAAGEMVGSYGLANGGIIKPTRGGTLATLAEAGMAEAAVPLPDGRSIPVSFNNLPDFSALSNNQNTGDVNINFGDVTISNDMDSKEFFKKVEISVNEALLRRNGRR